MITFSRTLLVGAEFPDEKTLLFHGVLEDSIYAMEIQLEVRIGDGTISKIEGRMKRYTTPVCPRAVACLQRAVGISLRAPDWVSKINGEVGRKGCQHFAEILIECGRCFDSVLLAGAVAEAREKNPAASPSGLARSWVRLHPEAQGACLARPRTGSPHAD